MIIKIPENPTQVRAVNLNAHDTISIRPSASGDEFLLALETDISTVNIERYPTRERAIQAFETLMDKLEEGDRVCDVGEL